MNFKEYLKESKYVIYHNSFTDAIKEVQKWTEKQGYEIDAEEMADKVGLGPVKPRAGKTNSYTILLTKNGKEQKKALHFQVYNRELDKNTYELNMYIS